MKEDKPLAKDNPGPDPGRGSVNRDPITGAPGAHPVGVGLGAAVAGAAAAAAAGTTAGPVGTLVGAAVGAVIGGLAGKSLAELVDPTVEDTYWQAHYHERPYVGADGLYDDYGPAYRYGVQAYTRHGGRSFDEADADLAAGWASARDASRLEWEHARPAARDAWQRAHEQVQQRRPS